MRSLSWGNLRSPHYAQGFFAVAIQFALSTRDASLDAYEPNHMNLGLADLWTLAKSFSNPCLARGTSCFVYPVPLKNSDVDAYRLHLSAEHSEDAALYLTIAGRIRIHPCREIRFGLPGSPLNIWSADHTSTKQCSHQRLSVYVAADPSHTWFLTIVFAPSPMAFGVANSDSYPWPDPRRSLPSFLGTQIPNPINQFDSYTEISDRDIYVVNTGRTRDRGIEATDYSGFWKETFALADIDFDRHGAIDNNDFVADTPATTTTVSMRWPPVGLPAAPVETAVSMSPRTLTPRLNATSAEGRCFIAGRMTRPYGEVAVRARPVRTKIR